MKLGLLTYNMAAAWDLDTLLAKSSALGFEGVELRTDREHAHGVEVETTAAERAGIKARCQDAGIEIAGLSSGCQYDSPDEDELAANIERTRQHLELCAELGAGGVKVFGNKLHVDEGIPQEQTVEQIGTALGECARYAEQLGVKVRFEMHGDFQAPQLCNELLGLADSDGICLIYNCNAADVADGSIRASYAAVADRLCHVHLHDLADPQWPYLELVKLLVADGYDGWCTAELADSEDRERVLGFYVALWEAYLRIAEA